MGQDVTPPISPLRLARWRAWDLRKLPSPCYVIDLDALEENCRRLAEIQALAGCKILLALKGFATAAAFETIQKYLKGTTASGLHEARFAHEFFKGENHVYCPAYKEEEVRALLEFADHMVFNSAGQWAKFKAQVLGAKRKISCGLRVNPQYAEVETALYNPCGENSRLGIRECDLSPRDLDGIEGLHFHALCEQNSDTLERVLAHFEARFSKYFSGLKWVNFGGGHHITRHDYDAELLVRLIQSFRARHPHLEVYLEPGEAVALGTGILAGTVLDIVPGAQMPTAILDISPACHMPDVLEMPYRPNLLQESPQGAFCYLLGAPSCLAGDVAGQYRFERPLQAGERLAFTDMAHYTMVKNTVFNGVALPQIAVYSSDTGSFKVVKTFGYEDYRNKLA